MEGIVKPEVERYAEAHTSPAPEHLRAVAEETRARMPSPQMMTGGLEGRFLELLVFALEAQTVLDVGTFTGYSALSMAAGLPPGGRVITCEADPDVAAVARRHFDRSPYGDRIDLRVGPALDTIAGLAGPFDFVFIDADKEGYRDYFEAVLPKLADRGLIAVDNTLWSGRVVNPGGADERTGLLAQLNEDFVRDPRIECVVLTVRDGVTLIRRAG